MIKIKKITKCCRYCDEADITITDGHFELICFCSECKFITGQELDVILSPLDTKNIIRISEKKYSVEKLAERYDYQLSGKLIKVTKTPLGGATRGIVIIGNIKIDLGYIPGDLNENDFISLQCSRLDLY